MKIDIHQLEDLCRRHGQRIQAKYFDGPRLMWALAMPESTDGAEIAPRHEDGYCRGGKHYDHVATEEWGCLAHCSYGPWQVMWINCGKVAPLVLLSDPETMAASSSAFIAELAARVSACSTLDTNGALALLAHYYNGPAVSAKYIADLTAAYEKGLPV